MSARIPSTYAAAPKLSAEARGALACARLVWESLATKRSSARGQRSRKQQALVDYWNEQGVPTRTRAMCPDSIRSHLQDLGLVSASGSRWAPLTPVGIMVREAGIRSTVEVNDAA